MKIQKLKNIFLAIIAFNLTFISITQLDLFSSNAYANENKNISELNYAMVPINADGSITIKISDLQLEDLKNTLQNDISVDLREIGGHDIAFWKADSAPYNAGLWVKEY